MKGRWRPAAGIGAAAGALSAALVIWFRVFAGHPFLEVFGTAVIAFVMMAIVGTVVFLVRGG